MLIFGNRVVFLCADVVWCVLYAVQSRRLLRQPWESALPISSPVAIGHLKNRLTALYSTVNHTRFVFLLVSCSYYQPHSGRTQETQAVDFRTMLGVCDCLHQQPHVLYQWPAVCLITLCPSVSCALLRAWLLCIYTGRSRGRRGICQITGPRATDNLCVLHHKQNRSTLRYIVVRAGVQCSLPCHANLACILGL